MWCKDEIGRELIVKSEIDEDGDYEIISGGVGVDYIYAKDVEVLYACPEK
jgi:hypothetical protein